MLPKTDPLYRRRMVRAINEAIRKSTLTHGVTAKAYPYDEPVLKAYFMRQRPAIAYKTTYGITKSANVNSFYDSHGQQITASRD